MEGMQRYTVSGQKERFVALYMTFKGKDGDTLSACKYGDVLQKNWVRMQWILSEFAKYFRYGSSFTTQILALDSTANCILL